MGDSERIPAAPRDDRPRCSRSSRSRLSFDPERRYTLRHEMVHFHEWPQWTAKPFRRSKILANEVPRRLQETYRFQIVRLVRRKSLHQFSTHPQTSDARCLLRRHGTDAGTVPEDYAANLNNHRPI